MLTFDAEFAAETLALWRSNSPFENELYFAARLAQDGITQDEFTLLLGTPVEAFGAHDAAPEWAGRLVAAYHVRRAEQEGHAHKWGNTGDIPAARFLNLIEPLMYDARIQLRTRVEKLKIQHPAAPFDAARSVETLFANLPGRLLMTMAKTLVLELQVARLEGVLQGATPEERFANFTERLSRTDIALKLLSEYPVLARRVVTCIHHWITFSGEFLEHLACDWEQIVKRFDICPDHAVLVEAAAGAGDTHRGGRSVLIARFEDGLQLVYKPRSIAVDEHFQQFLAWVNDNGAHPQLRTLKLLNRETHGWVEFVNTAACGSPEELERFYERQGEYLAILYVLQATDFHFENLLACGEHPVLVDLEALFHPWLRELNLKLPDIRMVACAQIGSVLRTGLLPRRIAANGDSIGMELSGLGGAPGQATENILQWQGEGTDQMAAVKQPFLMPGGRNRPTMNGTEIDARDFTEAIVSGFRRMYDLFSARKEELLSSGSPLDRFAEDEVRIVPRATRGYGMLLSQSLHPDYLRDALDLERLLDRLWAGVDHNPQLTPLIPAERRDLMQGDIPIFTARPASRDLFASDGQKLESYLPEAGMNVSRKTIASLSAEDCKRQVWFIRASMATLDLQANDISRTEYDPVWPASNLSARELRRLLIEEAARVGDRLAELALHEGKHATWIGFAKAKKIWSLDALQEDLYAGAPGIILALAYLGSFGFERHTELARRALNTLRARLDNTGSRLHSIGAFDGWGGIIYMLSHLAGLWQDAELISYADAILNRLPPLIDHDNSLDIIGGCAGCIGALLAFHHVSPSKKALAAAVRCGDRLLVTAQQVENGIGWFIKNIETVKPITGFAHGAAGIACALTQLFACTGERKYLDTALLAIAYEHGEYSPAAGNWAENAPGSEELTTGPSMAWCYGAPGIGLARLAALKCADDEIVRIDLDRAIQATLRRGPGSNHCLCHGDLGNLDFLLAASQAPGKDALGFEVNRWTNQVLASIRKYGWLSGVPLRVESPALMNGLAGICYGLLRMAEPDRVPSVLTLSPALVSCATLVSAG